MLAPTLGGRDGIAIATDSMSDDNGRTATLSHEAVSRWLTQT
jgi:hypothetical protein